MYSRALRVVGIKPNLILVFANSGGTHTRANCPVTLLRIFHRPVASHYSPESDFLDIEYLCKFDSDGRVKARHLISELLLTVLLSYKRLGEVTCATLRDLK